MQAIDKLRQSNEQAIVEEASESAIDHVPKRACVREKTVLIGNIKTTAVTAPASVLVPLFRGPSHAAD